MALPAPTPTPSMTRPVPSEEPKAFELRPWGLLAMLGAVFVLAAQVIALTEALEDAGGKQSAMIVLAFVGSAVVGLSLLAAGCFVARGSFGGRVALIAVGAYLLTASSPLSYLSLFGFGGPF